MRPRDGARIFKSSAGSANPVFHAPQSPVSSHKLAHCVFYPVSLNYGSGGGEPATPEDNEILHATTPPKIANELTNKSSCLYVPQTAAFVITYYPRYTSSFLELPNRQSRISIPALNWPPHCVPIARLIAGPILVWGLLAGMRCIVNTTTTRCAPHNTASSERQKVSSVTVTRDYFLPLLVSSWMRGLNGDGGYV